MNLFRKSVFVLIAYFVISPVAASDFDGSNALICATVEARDCVLSLGCFAGEASEVGAPAFMRIDFNEKVIKGPNRSTPIVAMERNENQMLLQGTELGYAWAFAINQLNGHFSASLTNVNGSFLLFGTCTLD